MRVALMIFIGNNHVIKVQVAAVRYGMRKKYKRMRMMGVPLWKARISTMAYVLESDLAIGNITNLVREDNNGIA